MRTKNKKEIKEWQNVILDSIADGVFTVDLNWKITSFNKAAEKITGIPRNSAYGKYCFEIFKANICQMDCALKHTMQTGQNIINKNITILNSVGKKVPVSISTSILKDKNGNVIGGVETFRDLSTEFELRKHLKKQYSFQDIISKSPKIQKIFHILEDIAKSDSTILITGESGTGKELFARAIHNLSHRKKKPFIPINCGGIPENLLESELFGYKKGAFTSALHDKPGKIELASGGTLFLDEIGEMPFSIQIKLLRFLQEHTYEPLGSTKVLKADIRIIAATNKNLFELVKLGKFREDLFYRINVMNITLPPLRERKEDIPFLVEYFIKKFNSLKNKNIKEVNTEVLRILMNYNFPGNVRELQNIIEHAFILCKGTTIEKKHIPLYLTKKFNELITPFSSGDLEIHSSASLNEIKKNVILAALKKNKFNKSKTAKELGIHKTTLYRLIKKFQLDI